MFIEEDLVLVALLPDRVNLTIEYGLNVAAGNVAALPAGSVTRVELEEIHEF